MFKHFFRPEMGHRCNMIIGTLADLAGLRVLKQEVVLRNWILWVKRNKCPP